MTTYLKHFYVDPITGAAFEENRQAPNGKTHPAIPNLDVQYWFTNSTGVDYCLSVTETAFDPSSFEGVTVMSQADWFADVEVEFLKRREAKVKEIFDYVKTIKGEIIDGWWHSSEISAAISVKVVEAKFVLEQTDEAVAIAGAPILAAESNARQISIFDLAARIDEHNNRLIIAEAIVSGHRGFITDQVDAITFTSTMEGARESFAQIGNFTSNSNNTSEGTFNYVESFNGVLQQLGL
jgi:hypothetical protein